MFSNIWRENSGKLAATSERQKVFAAIADAALWTVLDDGKRCSRDRKYSQHEISINQVVEQLDEDDQKTKPSEKAT